MSFQSPVKTFHDDTYPSTNHTLPHLSTKGKNVVLSGRGSGIGPEIARSFAKSGAPSISIFGRTSNSLLQTKLTLETVYTAIKIYTYITDITDRETLDTTFQAIKSAVGSWTGFEINVRGAFNLISSFVPVASKNASIINISTAVSHMPYVPSGSGYTISKLARTRVFDYAVHEYLEDFVLSLYPGVIETAMDAKTVAAGINFPHDTINLPADFVVLAVSSEAKFLQGKLVWSYWDVDELNAMKEGD